MTGIRASEHPGISDEPFIYPDTTDIPSCDVCAEDISEAQCVGSQRRTGEIRCEAHEAKTPTIRIQVTETVTYNAHVELTPALLDEAADEGYDRTAVGVAEYLAGDPDHPEVLGVVSERTKSGALANLVDVLERDVRWNGEVY